MRPGIADSTIRRTLITLTFGAILLRLLIFLGRGDYIAFDEGWYLLLGQSLWSGEGYRLTGLRHTTLSPLFPILAGGLGRLLGDPVWAGRVVAAITSGLLVIPCWSIFRRLAGRRTALFACAIVALTPSLAPFVAPEWVGWDLWVGAEPVYHLFLYSGIALSLRAFDGQRRRDWILAGGALALAFLARPEAVVVTGLLGFLAVTLALYQRRTRLVVGPIVAGLAFAIVVSPYLLLLRDATGQWTITGRSVQIRKGGDAKSSASGTIERMLWEGRQGAYVRVLFALDPSGTRMANTYWGVPQELETLGAQGPSGEGADLESSEESDLPEVASSAPAKAADSGSVPSAASATPERVTLYARALGKIVPSVLIPFILLGLLAPRRRDRATELLFTAPLVIGSLAIAYIVAIDPRTQLFLVPALAFYAARGGRLLGVIFDSKISKDRISKKFVPALVILIMLTTLTTENVRRLYMSLSLETTHQFVAAENRRAGEELRRLVPEGEAIVSWHPAVALHARRDWRVLPLATLPAVVKYAASIGSEYVVLSAYNPSPIPVESTGRPYMLLQVPQAAAAATQWRIELMEAGEEVTISRLIVE